MTDSGKTSDNISSNNTSNTSDNVSSNNSGNIISNTHNNALQPATKLTHDARGRDLTFGFVNPPTIGGSSVLFETIQDLEETPWSLRYGTHGTPATRALGRAVADLEGGFDALTTCSGLSALTVAVLAFVHSGDHVLIPSQAYHPLRTFAKTFLARMGIQTTFYDPLIGGDITREIRANTRLICMESPCSDTMEMQDVRAIVAAAKNASITTIIDNTWGGPLHHRPLTFGVDVSVLAATKYIGGHGDLLAGMMIARDEPTFETVRETYRRLGQCPGSQEVSLALRGLRTLPLRLTAHERNARTLIDWLLTQPVVDKVLYPPHPDDPGHALWARDFTGGCGLFSVLFKPPIDKDALHQMIDRLTLFHLGYSWGAYTSLVRHALDEQPLVRFHAGLEDPVDLIADLARAFEELPQAKAVR
ncbi:MAG: PLP-dependent aspartate aminotransferase family protein [Pseudomonadota bacterium]